MSTKRHGPRTTEIVIGRHRLTVTICNGKRYFSCPTMEDLPPKYDGCDGERACDCLNEFERRATAVEAPSAYLVVPESDAEGDE